jgi:regulator of cell morphogenesis and NO signaling
MPTIDTIAVEEMTVNETIQRFPRTVAVFDAHGIDACCGGALPVAEAAARHDIALPELLKALEAAK